MNVPDGTLDALLATLIESPRDAALIAIIADRLMDLDHPAATAWRRWSIDPPVRLHYAGKDAGGVGVWMLVNRITGASMHSWAGGIDLAQRLDRLAGRGAKDN